MIEMAKKGWVNGLVLNVRRIGMRVMTHDEMERLRREKLPFDDLIEEIRPMERVYLHELNEIIDEFERIVCKIWANTFYVTNLEVDLSEYRNELSLKEQWDDFKDRLSYISDRYDPIRIVGVTTMLDTMREELRYLELTEDQRLLRFDGDEDRMKQYEDRLNGKVKE